MTSKIYSIFVLICLILIPGCIDKIKSPVMPVWDVTYSIPVVNRTETVAERIKGVSGIFIDSTSQHLLVKFDSTRVESKPLDEIFSDKIEYEDEFAIKPQNVDTIKFESFVKDDSVQLEEFHLYKGTLLYEVSNYLDKKIDVNVTIPGFTKGLSDTLKFEIIVPPNSTVTKSIDLKNYKYRQVSNPISDSGYGFYIKGYAKIDAGYSGDSVKTKFKINNLGFNYVKGKIKPYEEELKSKSFFVDVDEEAKDIIPKVQVYGAKILLTPSTTINDFEVQLKNFEIIGSFVNKPTIKKLKIKNKSTIDTTISLNEKPIVFNLDDLDIEDFLNEGVPDSISYRGKFIVNPNYRSIEIILPDTIQFEIQFLIYSIFRINYASRTDTAEIEIPDDYIEQLDKVNESKLIIDVDNGLPFGVKITGFLLDSLNRKLIYITREQGGETPNDTVFQIISASVNNEGVVINSAKQTKVISLSKDDTEKIKRAKKAIVNVVAYTTNGQKVFLRSGDRISFKVRSSISVKVDTQ